MSLLSHSAVQVSQKSPKSTVEKERSLVAVMTGRVPKRRSKTWMIGNHIKPRCPLSSTSDSRSVAVADHFTHRLSYSAVSTRSTAPRYLASELQRVADTASHWRLRSASSPALHVPRSLHKTIGDRAFPVTTAKVWNKLPPAITSLSSLNTFKRALKTELFRRSYGDAHHVHSNIDCSVM